jgi:hypothetical protein
MRTIVLGVMFALGVTLAAPEVRAETTEEILQQIIKDLIANPPETSGEYAVGEQMC